MECGGVFGAVCGRQIIMLAPYSVRKKQPEQIDHSAMVLSPLLLLVWKTGPPTLMYMCM